MEESKLEALSRVSGLNRAEMDDIFQKVKANQKLLDGCAGHDFSIPERKRGQFVMSYKCSRCGGVVEHSAKRWYERGLKHGQHTEKNL